MQFLVKKWFIFALFLCGTTQAFSQTQDHFIIKGEIENPQTSTIHFSSFVRCNSKTGCSKFSVNKNWSDYTRNNRDINVTNKKQKFILRNIEIKNEKQIFFLFDSLGRNAQLIVSKKNAIHGVINVGKINLQDPALVSANISFPDFISEKNRKELVITFSFLQDGGMHLVGSTQLNEQDQMNIRLLPGKYTIFFDVPDDQDNWRRVTKNIEVGNTSIHLGEITISTNLDQLIAENKPFEEIFIDFDYKQLDINEIGLITNIKNAPVTLVYFLAGYCGPCLGDDGLSKYLKLAKEFPGQFAVIGIHSDSYRMTKNCPTSQNDMMDYVTNKQPWSKIKSAYEAAQGNPVLLSWQPAEFAEKLSINGYPTTLIFKDGVIQKWFVGTNPLIEEQIRSYLK